MSAYAVKLLVGITAQNALRAAQSESWATIARLLVLMAVMLGLALAARNAPQTVVILAGLVLAFVPSRIRMLRVSQQVLQGWPATLAINRTTQYAVAWCCAAAPVVLVLVLTAVLAWQLGTDPAIILYALVATAGGALASGLWLGRGGIQRYPDSRYRRSRPETEARFNLKPIGLDLHAFVAVRMRPEVLAKTSVPLLLVAPRHILIQELILIGLAVIALLYASFLLGALPEFMRHTRNWTASSPLSSDRLEAVIRRALWPRFVWIGLFMMPGLLLALGWVRTVGCLLVLFALSIIWAEINVRRWRGRRL